MIRILTNEFYPRTGGIATYSLELAKALVKLGREVSVACPDFGGQIPDFPFAIEPFKSRGTQDPDDLWRISRVIRRHLKDSPESTLFLTEPAPIKSLLLLQGFADLSGTRLWITFHGSELARLAGQSFWRKRLLKLAPKVDRFIVNSPFTRRLLLEQFPDWESRVRIVQPALSREWKDAFAGIDRKAAGPTRILTVARLHPRKGQVDVLKSLSSIECSEEKPLSYHIIGEARRAIHREEIEKAAADCRHDVLMSGSLEGSALKKAFSEADIFVMVSQPDPRSIESFGIVYLEAAAAGLPVIAADVGGVRDALLAGETALLIPPADPVALREALSELITNPEKRARMGEAGRRFATRFSWEESARELLK